MPNAYLDVKANLPKLIIQLKKTQLQRRKKITTYRPWREYARWTTKKFLYKTVKEFLRISDVPNDELTAKLKIIVVGWTIRPLGNLTDVTYPMP
ncbi:hypothetical protein H5410_062485 [Solanum commersonii]|uniref:Uncharacterized protein n=1 Tax=Solanum commersonii TaxID=4109 RepID=A0A9J5WBN2_SOLCO|nr:hypothetical protein H5410_062485 [Solanum commersonii]